MYASGVNLTASDDAFTGNLATGGAGGAGGFGGRGGMGGAGGKGGAGGAGGAGVTNGGKGGNGGNGGVGGPGGNGGNGSNGGNATGGGLYDSGGTLVLTGDTLSGNIAQGGVGGSSSNPFFGGNGGGRGAGGAGGAGGLGGALHGSSGGLRGANGRNGNAGGGFGGTGGTAPPGAAATGRGAGSTPAGLPCGPFSPLTPWPATKPGPVLAAAAPARPPTAAVKAAGCTSAPPRSPSPTIPSPTTRPWAASPPRRLPRRRRWQRSRGRPVRLRHTLTLTNDAFTTNRAAGGFGGFYFGNGRNGGNARGAACTPSAAGSSPSAMRPSPPTRPRVVMAAPGGLAQGGALCRDQQRRQRCRQYDWKERWLGKRRHGRFRVAAASPVAAATATAGTPGGRPLHQWWEADPHQQHQSPATSPKAVGAASAPAPAALAKAATHEGWRVVRQWRHPHPHPRHPLGQHRKGGAAEAVSYNGGNGMGGGLYANGGCVILTSDALLSSNTATGGAGVAGFTGHAGFRFSPSGSLGRKRR